MYARGELRLCTEMVPPGLIGLTSTELLFVDECACQDFTFLSNFSQKEKHTVFDKLTDTSGNIITDSFWSARTRTSSLNHL